PRNCELVGSDVAPAELLASCDFVISDHSGAAFDAALARVPLLLADLPDRDRDAQSRLGAGEPDRPLLRDPAVMWRPGIDPRAVVAQAATLVQDDEAYAAFLHRYLSNPGSAGAACADAIRRLLSEGPPAHSPRERVASRERQLIARERGLASEVRRL